MVFFVSHDAPPSLIHGIRNRQQSLENGVSPVTELVETVAAKVVSAAALPRVRGEVAAHRAAPGVSRACSRTVTVTPSERELGNARPQHYASSPQHSLCRLRGCYPPMAMESIIATRPQSGPTSCVSSRGLAWQRFWRRSRNAMLFALTVTGCEPIADANSRAGGVRLVEHWPSKPVVAGSNPVSRSNFPRI